MEPIDVVVLWVDGNDPAWRAEKAKYDGSSLKSEIADFRYRDWGLMRYWFRCIDKFMPWARRIFFVTWGHLPDFLDAANPRLRIVRHDEFMPREWLPTFSSHAIEMNLHRIPDLSEHFVYFNDDTFVIAPMKPEDFFRKGLPCLEGIEHILSLHGENNAYDHALLNDTALINRHFRKRDVFLRHPFKWLSPAYGPDVLRNFQMLLLLPRYSAFRCSHQCAPMRKSTYEKVWAAAESVLSRTSSHRFREFTDVNQFVIRYWELCSGTFHPVRLPMGMFRLADKNPALLRALATGKPKRICVNDTNWMTDEADVQRQLTRAFEALVPEKCSFEK